MGLPGSGKGTQGALLSEHFGVPHIASGKMIRDNIARGTEFGRKVQAAIAAGNFAPDEDVLDWICARLAQPDAENGYVLDGFPRDLAQAKVFDKHNDDIGRKLDAVVELAIEESVLIARLSGRLVCPKCGESYHIESRPPAVPGICDRDGTPLVRRPDDDPVAISRRFEVYYSVTEPLIDYYREGGVYMTVDADAEADVVFDRIRCLVESLDCASS